jgi:hypothetical protein
MTARHEDHKTSPNEAFHRIANAPGELRVMEVSNEEKSLRSNRNLDEITVHYF